MPEVQGARLGEGPDKIRRLRRNPGGQHYLDHAEVDGERRERLPSR